MDKIKSYNKRYNALVSERSTFLSWYQDLSDYHLAHRGRFLADRNKEKGLARNTKQINNRSRLSVRTLASGMLSGLSSPARPWFRLSSGDNELDDDVAVRQWLFDVQTLMYQVFSASNLYNSLYSVYSELGVFGTACMGVYHDFENVIWCDPYTVGSYVLALNGKNEVDTFYREYDMSVAQLVSRFGIENVSNDVRQRWNTGNTESSVTVIHVIEPNDDRDHLSPLATDKKFRSAYYERAGSNRADCKYLRESGFDMFPVMAPRWDVTATDTYATDCPGMTALGDTKALQVGEKRLYQAIDKIATPPLQGPSSLADKFTTAVMRGDEVLWNDSKTDGITSIYQNYRPDLNGIKQVNIDAENRIKESFYVDLFLMLASTDRRQITAREVAERHEEKLLMLGPVLERLHTELFNPLIDRTFSILQKANVLPEPPETLVGRDISVEYVSILAQAQRLVNTGGVDRLTQFVADVSQLWPEARYKVDALQAVDDYANALGTNPAMVKSDRQVEEAMAIDAQQAQAAQAAQMAETAAGVAKQASDTSTQGDNLLGSVMQQAGLG